ncbi:MAG: ATP-binding protein [Candidatus Saccharibacteria bacterium]
MANDNFLTTPDGKDNTVNPSVRWSSILIPITAILYGFAIRLGIFNVPHPNLSPGIGNIDLYVISALLLLIGIWQLIANYDHQAATTIRLFTYQITFGLFLIFISGFTSPFALAWVVIMSGPEAYQNSKAFFASAVLFLFIIFIGAFTAGGGSAGAISYSIVAILTIGYTGWTITKTQLTNSVNKDEIVTSKTKESLQRDQFLTIINNLSDAVISTDIDGTIRVYNAASLNLLDTNTSLNGRNISEILPVTNDRHEPVNLFREIKKSKTIVERDDLTHTFSDGEEMRLEVTYSPIRKDFQQATQSKAYDGYIVIARDITKSKTLAEERDEFISVISHELRTPITVAEGTISNVQLMMDRPKTTPKMLKDGVNMAHDQIMFLANMVNELSALSRAERGVGGESEIIDVTELAHQMISEYSNEANKRGLHLDLDLAPKIGKVETSRAYIEELLQNLIANGIKYTKKGGVKFIIDKKDGKINFAVKDTGIGIGKSDIDKVFDKFYRSEDYRTRETGGTGLGLYVAAKLAHKMGTKIVLSSRLNIGSKFSFELPEYTKTELK